LGRQELPQTLVLRAPLVRREILVRQAHQGRQQILALPVKRAHKATLARLAHKVILARLDPRALLVKLAPLAFLDSQQIRVPRAGLVSRVPRV
jgi:hypothetical protein